MGEREERDRQAGPDLAIRTQVTPVPTPFAWAIVANGPAGNRTVLLKLDTVLGPLHLFVGEADAKRLRDDLTKTLSGLTLPAEPVLPTKRTAG